MKTAFLRLVAAVVIAGRAIARSTLRAALTILGITIGIAAVVTMTALGRGAREAVGGQIASLGSNALIVFPESTRSSGARSGAAGTGSRLSELDCDALVQGSTSIAAVAPFMNGLAQVIYEGENVRHMAIGTRRRYFEIRGWNLVRGELWTESQESVSARVVVLGTMTARELFGPVDPIGRTIRIGRHPYTVLGVLEEKGASPLGQNQDEVVIMPITTMRAKVLPSRANDTHGLLVSATSAETTDRAKAQTEAILRQRHRIAEGEEDDFVVRSQAEFQALQESIFGALSALLVSIAGISLVVGGIGVMNIMLVGVTERTREIGIRMAIGARELDIMVQFLVESVLLALLGGAFGTGFGYLAIRGIGGALDLPLTLDQDALIAALAVSSIVGVVFGFVPARRAARLDPVLALGRE
jgi:putative ABC transport system permease protein